MKSLLIVAVLASRAHAIGLCEDTPRRYAAPSLYSPVEHAFAVPVTQAWCEVAEGSSLERRGTISYVELVGTGATVRLSAATGTDAARLEHAVGSFEPVTRLDVELARRGYAPISSTSRACSVAVAWLGDAVSDGGWPMIEMGIDVRRGATRITRDDVGAAAKARQKESIMRAHWLRSDGVVVVFTVVPTCAGPPPGYFGDANGSCYRVDTPDVRVIAAKDCF